jgi:hypothetical protein
MWDAAIRVNCPFAAKPAARRLVAAAPNADRECARAWISGRPKSPALSVPELGAGGLFVSRRRVFTCQVSRHRPCRSGGLDHRLHRSTRSAQAAVRQVESAAYRLALKDCRARRALLLARAQVFGESWLYFTESRGRCPGTAVGRAPRAATLTCPITDWPRPLGQSNGGSPRILLRFFDRFLS